MVREAVRTHAFTTNPETRPAGGLRACLNTVGCAPSLSHARSSFLYSASVVGPSPPPDATNVVLDQPKVGCSRGRFEGIYCKSALLRLRLRLRQVGKLDRGRTYAPKFTGATRRDFTRNRVKGPKFPGASAGKPTTRFPRTY